MTATWSITRLPSQVQVRIPADLERRQLARRANGLPDPSQWML